MEAKDRLDEEALKSIINKGESYNVEFKIKPPRPAELAERICGLANSRKGGYIIFGIEDGTGYITGIEKPNESIDVILYALRLIKPQIPVTNGGPVELEYEGRILLVLIVPSNNGTLYQAGGVFWLRKGSFNIPMNAMEVEERLNSHGANRWEKNSNRATLEDVNPATVEKFLSYRAEQGRRNMRYTSTNDLLVGLECAVQESDELKPTNAGLLMFGYDPQLFIPHSEVVCIRYADSLGVGKYIDRKNLTGNVPELIDKATDFLYLHVRLGGSIKGFKRADLPEYPLEALREAVVNAIIHRDYSRIGETVRIFIYTDRIEIRSPGLLLPGMSLDDFAQMRTTSRPRNPLLAQLIRDIPGYMERVGSGVRLMIHEMRGMGLPDPQFQEHHEFVVTFNNSQSSDNSGSDNPLNPRQIIALNLIRERGSITSSELRAVTGAGETTALRDLTDLLNKGIIISRGERKARRYYLP
jgi:ATP-dependent DNA helicase RecG